MFCSTSTHATDKEVGNSEHVGSKNYCQTFSHRVSRYRRVISRAFLLSQK